MSSPPDSVEGTRRSKLLTPRWWWPLLAGVLFGIAYRLLFSQPAGQPNSAMMSSFTLLVPALVGAVTIVTAESTRRRSWASYFCTAALANALLVFGALAISIEGLICSVLAVPLFAAVGGTSGLLTGVLCRLGRRPRNSVYGLAILPLVLGGIEQYVPLPDSVSTAEQSRSIAATPEQVWARLLSTEAIRPEEMDAAWMYRIGVPLPLSAQSEEGNGRLVRHVTMGKNIHFDQIATHWEPGHGVLWTIDSPRTPFPRKPSTTTCESVVDTSTSSTPSM